MNTENETFDELYTYRNITVQIWNDDYGQCKFLRFLNDPLFGTQDIGLGSFNTNYKEDINYIIDQKLDNIYYFDEPYLGAKLEWFQNGLSRDIRLIYRLRILKVFIVIDPNKLNIENLKKECMEILDKIITL